MGISWTKHHVRKRLIVYTVQIYYNIAIIYNKQVGKMTTRLIVVFNIEKKLVSRIK